MPITKTITLYTFDELPTEKAKNKARDWWRECDYGRYDGVYEDAAQAGIKITGFNIDPGSSCDIEFLDGAFNCAVAVRANHGETCDTYKAAVAYEAACDDVNTEAEKRGDQGEARRAETLDAVEEEFKQALEKAYLEMLRDEYEDRQSDEYLDDVLRCNDYTFTETGEREDA